MSEWVSGEVQRLVLLLPVSARQLLLPPAAETADDATSTGPARQKRQLLLTSDTDALMQHLLAMFQKIVQRTIRALVKVTIDNNFHR